MHIAIIADSIDTQNAGIHVYTKNMIESLQQESNFKVTCLHIKKNPIIKYSNEIIVPPVIPFLKKDPLRLFFTLPKAIRRLNPDIVIEPAHFGPFNLPKKIKCVTVIHDLTPVLFPKWHNFMSQFLQRLFFPSILKRASLIITNSNNTQKDLYEIYPSTKNKSVSIYPGTDPYYIINRNEVSFVKEPFFLFTGTIEPRKNLAVLLDAYQLFRDKTKLTHKLIICGSKGWKSKSFYKKHDEHPYKNDIEFKGYVDREYLKKLYRETTALIYPSLYEGFGLPVAEAMSCGAPCIVSRNSSLTEVGGYAADYFDPANPYDLYQRMLEITQSPKHISDMINKGLIQSKMFLRGDFLRSLKNELLKLK